MPAWHIATNLVLAVVLIAIFLHGLKASDERFVLTSIVGMAGYALFNIVSVTLISRED
jgi:ABC-type polysaccharide/polyol phosphate export permease